jgi:hypothetical protein
VTEDGRRRRERKRHYDDVVDHLEHEYCASRVEAMPVEIKTPYPAISKTVLDAQRDLYASMLTAPRSHHAVDHPRSGDHLLAGHEEVPVTRAPHPDGTVARYVGSAADQAGQYVLVDCYDPQEDRYEAVLLTGPERHTWLRKIRHTSLIASEDLTNIHRQDEIFPGLWMSGTPDKWLPDVERFDLVVTAWKSAPVVDSTMELRVHFADSLVLSAKTKDRIGEAVATIADSVTDGRQVLVRCQAGMNRSGLIVGLTLRELGLTGDEAVDLIRTQRWHQCLRNPMFERYVRKGM